MAAPAELAVVALQLEIGVVDAPHAGAVPDQLRVGLVQARDQRRLGGAQRAHDRAQVERPERCGSGVELGRHEDVIEVGGAAGVVVARPGRAVVADAERDRDDRM